MRVGALIYLFVCSADILAAPYFSADFLNRVKKELSCEVPTAVYQMPNTYNTSQLPRNPKIDIDYYLDTLAFIYAASSIVVEYKAVYGASSKMPDSYLGLLRHYILTNLYLDYIVAQGGKHADFFVRSVSVVLQTLFFKTIVKLVILCGKDDLSDIFERVLVRSKKIASAVIAA